MPQRSHPAALASYSDGIAIIDSQWTIVTRRSVEEFWRQYGQYVIDFGVSLALLDSELFYGSESIDLNLYI